MFCGHCGNYIKDGEKFCGKCGWHVPDTEDAGDAQPSEKGAAEEPAKSFYQPPLETGPSDYSSEAPTSYLPNIDPQENASSAPYGPGAHQPAQGAYANEPAPTPPIYGNTQPGQAQGGAPSAKPKVKLPDRKVLIGAAAACAVVVGIGIGVATAQTGGEPAAAPTSEAVVQQDTASQDDTEGTANNASGESDSADEPQPANVQEDAQTQNANAQQDEPSEAENSAVEQNTAAEDAAAVANTSTQEDSSAYILPDSGTVRLTESDLAGLSDDQLSLAMNEIWARHGRMFKNEWLQSYFDGQSWYTGAIAADDFLSVYKPTDIENDNASLISGVLSSHGYDVNRNHPNA